MHRHSFLALILALAAMAMPGCKKVSSRQDLEHIQELEGRVDKNRETVTMGTVELDTTLVMQLGTAYLQWADKYPDAPETPEFLFRAGELYSNELQDFPKAIEIFHRNYKAYPQHETAANSLFFIGYLYNNSLQDTAKAEEYYNEFLKKYPTHAMAKHAQFELGSLGMSDEQVFDQILRQDSMRTDSAAVGNGI